MPTINAWNSANPCQVSLGGTGNATLTNHGVLVGAGTSAVTQLAVGTNGQVLLGSSAADPVFATLTSTDGSITFTTGAGTLNLAVTPGAGFVWANTTVNASIVADHGYIANKAGLLTMTLPASSTLGDTFSITNINTAAGWLIAQNANQNIRMGNSVTTTGVGGSLAATALGDTITCVCVVGGASANWVVISSMGNITIV